jgi:hypothetical protein
MPSHKVTFLRWKGWRQTCVRLSGKARGREDNITINCEDEYTATYKLQMTQLQKLSGLIA